MNEEARTVNAQEEPTVATAEELGSAHAVMQAMVRSAKGLRMYLPNNPVLIRFLEELSAKMAGHIASYGDFKLDVERSALRYRGAELYANPDPKESLAFRIFSDGIRLIVFSEGLEQRELTVFLGIVAFERPSGQDDDIVTQLWERTLPHINYLLEEDHCEPEPEDEPAGEGQPGAITALLASLVDAPPSLPRMLPKHLLMLSRDEVSWLRKAKQAELTRNSSDDALQIFSAVLSGVEELELFRDFVEIGAKLAGNMFLAGDVGQALRLVRLLDRLARSPQKSVPQRRLLREAITGILSESTVHVLQETIDSGETVSHEELKELLRIFGLPSLGAICELLGRVEKLKMRKVIVEVLVEIGRDRPEVFAPFLSDPRWYLVRNVVLVLSLLGIPAALEMIVGLISHREQRIRREVLGYLERSADPKAKPYLLKYLRDESSALRIKALQILARERLPFAFKPIQALSAAEDFKGRELAEKLAVYEALGELGAERMIPVFREMLLKKYWFKKGVERENILCAVAGVSRVGGTVAIELLKQSRGQRSPELREIIDQAIAALGSAQVRAAAERLEV